MPYGVKKQGSGWVKYKKDTGKVVSHHATKEKAEASIRAYYANTKVAHLAEELHKLAAGVLSLAKKTGIFTAAKNYIGRGSSRAARTTNRRNVVSSIRNMTNTPKKFP